MMKKVFSLRKYLETHSEAEVMGNPNHWAVMLNGISVDTLESKTNFRILDAWTEMAEVEECFLTVLYKCDDDLHETGTPIYERVVPHWAKEIDKCSLEWIDENTHYAIVPDWVGEYANLEAEEEEAEQKDEEKHYYFSVAKWWNWNRKNTTSSIDFLSDCKKRWADECNGLELNEAKSLSGVWVMMEWCNLL